MGIFELDDPPAVDTDEVIVRGFVEEVGVVGGLIITEIDFTEQVCFDQQTKCAVNGGAGGFGIEFSGAIKEFIGCEMFVFGERGLDDGFTLPGPAKALAADEFVKSFLNGSVHCRFLAFRNCDGKRKPRRASLLGQLS